MHGEEMDVDCNSEDGINAELEAAVSHSSEEERLESESSEEPSSTSTTAEETEQADNQGVKSKSNDESEDNKTTGNRGENPGTKDKSVTNTSLQVSEKELVGNLNDVASEEQPHGIDHGADEQEILTRRQTPTRGTVEGTENDTHRKSEYNNSAATPGAVPVAGIDFEEATIPNATASLVASTQMNVSDHSSRSLIESNAGQPSTSNHERHKSNRSSSFNNELPENDQSIGSQTSAHCQCSADDGYDVEAAPDDTEEIPMVRAELVAPPIHAVQVTFDERPLEIEEGSPPIERRQVESYRNTKKLSPNAKMVAAMIVFVCVALIVVIQITMSKGTDNAGPPPTGTLGGPESSSTVAPTFDYECFTSTYDLARAQLLRQEQQLFILCPNTTIKIGKLADPGANNYEVINGDYPLVATRGSIEVRCGLDGKRDNNCVLEGGFLQVALVHYHRDLPLPLLFQNGTSLAPYHFSDPNKDDDWLDDSRDNITVRGITFTGELTNTVGSVGGVSVLAAYPGSNVSFVACSWENMSTPMGLAHVRDPLDSSTVAALNASLQHLIYIGVTFEECTFSNIKYGYDRPLIGVFGEDVAVTLKGCQFRDLSLSQLFQSCFHPQLEWCQAILYCFDSSACIIEDHICVQNIEYAGPAAIATADFEATLIASGPYFVQGANLAVTLPATSSPVLCTSGLAHFLGNDFENYSCATNSVDSSWKAASSCVV